MMSGREPAIGARDEIDFGTDRHETLSQFEPKPFPRAIRC